MWQKGQELYREMPWRADTRPYYILVSELMLQQTQVTRVLPKFIEFIRAFPDEQALSSASLGDVLRHWQGLGYNRRAKYLHEAARMVVEEWGGMWPRTVEELQKLPGVGVNTAGAMVAYAYNKSTVFVETNIRTVYLLHFFENKTEVNDAALRDKVAQTIDTEHPREFYWALMDYGTWLKSRGVRNISASMHYRRQSKLEGSIRQVRGQIVSVLARQGTMSEQELRRQLDADERFEVALEGVVRDGLVSRPSHDILHLTK